MSDALPQDVAHALALLTAAHHKLVQIRSAAVHRLHCDDGCCVVAERTQRQFMWLQHTAEEAVPAAVGLTLQRGRWRAAAPSESRSNPPSEFYQRTC